MAKGFTIILMEIYIMDLGLMIKKKDKEHWKLLIKIFIPGSGNNRNTMVMEITSIFMGKNTEEIIKTAYEKERVNCHIRMVVFMKEIFKKILHMDMVK